MNQRMTFVCAGAVLTGVVTAGPVAAQQTSTDELKMEIQALQESLKAIQKDLQEIKGMLARPSPLGIGAVIDYRSGPARGERTAKLTLVEFSDYRWPYCAQYVRETYPQIESWVAFKAAQAAGCAGEQGKYWEMHDRLFANQQALEPWTAHAEAVGLELPRFEECLTSGRLGPEIRRRMGEGRKARVSSTPSFVIGRTEAEGSTLKVLAVVRGAKAFAEFKAELDKLLAEAEKPAVAAEAAKP